VPPIRSHPVDLGRLDTEMEKPIREIPAHRAEHQGSPTGSGKRSEPPKSRIRRLGGDLRIDGREAFEKRSRDLGPVTTLPATHNDQSVEVHPHLPCGKGAEPSPDVDCSDRAQLRCGGEQGQAQPGQTRAWRANEPEHTPRFGFDLKGRGRLQR
jgi:hypothetical protein